MRCSMCGCDVGADYQQVGASRFCNVCTGHYPSTVAREENLAEGKGYVECLCAKCAKPLFSNDEWEFVGKEKWHKSCAEEKFEKAINPSHYTDKAIETIDIIKSELTTDGFEGFLAGNVLKYVSRYRNKNGLEDLKKAKWYLERLINEKESNPTSR